MKIALVDLKFGDKKANRDHTGGFGSFMQASGVIGGLVSRMKANLIELPVMSLGFATSILEQAGHTVTFTQGADLAGQDIVIIANSMHCYADELVWARRQRKLMPEAKIGFYGPFVYEQQVLFKNDADFMIGGELESALFAFLDNEIELMGPINRGVVKDLTRLPFPDWRAMDHKKFNYFPLLHKRPFFPVQSTRGCTFNCDFCPYMVSQTKAFRRRDPVHVVDEIERNVRDFGMRSMLFRDICFTLNKKHARAISELLIERDLKVEWACETRIDCLDESLIDVMVEAGLRGVNLGIETGANDILLASGKKNPAVALQERIVGYLHEKGVRINGFYMLGLTGDTEESMEDTIEYAKHLNTLGAQFCITTPFPGTDLYESVKGSLLTTDFTQFTEYRPVVNIETSTPDQVRKAHGRAYRDYYLRPSWLLGKAPTTIVRLIANSLS